MRAISMCAVIVMVALALAGIAVDSCAYGQGGGRADKDLLGKFCHKVAFVMDYEEEIALTEDQVKSIEDLKVNTRKNLIKVEADIDVVEIDIGEALNQDNIDVPAIDALIDKQYILKGEMAKNLAASFAALKVILTPEQKDKLKALLKARKEDVSGLDIRSTMRCPKCSSKMEKAP
jgi:Spy/CpxP family protein refolding chaperone